MEGVPCIIITHMSTDYISRKTVLLLSLYPQDTLQLSSFNVPGASVAGAEACKPQVQFSEHLCVGFVSGGVLVAEESVIGMTSAKSFEKLLQLRVITTSGQS